VALQIVRQVADRLGRARDVAQRSVHVALQRRVGGKRPLGPAERAARGLQGLAQLGISVSTRSTRASMLRIVASSVLTMFLRSTAISSSGSFSILCTMFSTELCSSVKPPEAVGISIGVFARSTCTLGSFGKKSSVT
jgi:hypothetical protein